jgi:hypothetical protein
MHFNNLIIFVVLLLFASCSSKPIPELKNFNKNIWVSDKMACKDERAQFRLSIQTQMNLLKGLKESAILEILGKPDQNELMPRNQKHFSWYITPAPGCETYKNTLTEKLIIRFNATGLAQEIGFE